MKLIPKYQNAWSPLKPKKLPLITAPWVPKKITKDDYMQTDLGKVANFEMPEVTISGKSSTGNSLKDANLYGAYRGRRYYHLGMQEAQPIAAGMAALTAAPAFTGMYPAVSTVMSNPIVLGIFAVDGLKNVASDNGVAKTYRHLSNGEYGKAAISGTGDLLDVTGGLGLMKTGINIGKNIEKRAVETLMRTSNTASPLSEISGGIKKIIKKEPLRFKDIIKYIVAGKYSNNKRKGYYNSFAYPHYMYYTGFWGSPTGGNDLIDAFLYKKIIDPKFGVHKVDTKDFGPHTLYVKKNYPDKEVQVYEVNRIGDVEKVKTKQPWIGEGETDTYKVFEDPKTGSSVDAGGHLLLKGSIGNLNYARALDIWKFNYNEYLNRYEPFARQSPIRKSLIKYGLKTLDRIGTPIITKTSWKNISENN